MNQPLRIGLIGAGMVSRHHLVAWADIADRARVIAITDPSRENATRRANEFGISHIYADAEAMFRRPNLTPSISRPPANSTRRWYDWRPTALACALPKAARTQFARSDRTRR